MPKKEIKLLTLKSLKKQFKELKLQILEKEKRDIEKISKIKEEVSFLVILDKRRTICRRNRKSKKS